MKRFIKVAIIICFALLISGAVAYSSDDQKMDQAAQSAEKFEPDSSWIVKWEADAPIQFWDETELVRKYDDLDVMLVEPMSDVDADDWKKKWSAAPGLVYLHENQKLNMHALPNDPFVTEQMHLDVIKAKQAWDVVNKNEEVKIAIVDTGVDLDHPDLSANLVTGYNLLDPDSPPDDDAGHGTKVAGVLAAVGNNNRGVTGLLWSARVMPIKVMDAKGNGREIDLGEGIRYAVDHGADIVVLSLGLYRYSPFIEEVVQYAESKGVLLIAASGNDGQEVQYPAAYPTVLAVGGVNANKQVYPTSNYGPELDLVAPWQVYTTMRGGDYTYDQGTSMAAPQVAGVAALVMAKHPDLKPYQVRNLLRQTADPIGGSGWNPKSGYGLLRADRALTTTYKEDFYEPNDTASTSKILPIGKMTSAEISSSSDADWFKIEPDYKGTVSFSIEANSKRELENLKMTYYAGTPSSGNRVQYDDLTKDINISVDAGNVSYIVIESNTNISQPIGYRMTTQFQMAPDEFENNDYKYNATSLTPRQKQVMIGNFHKQDDQDWFVMNIKEKGVLNVEVASDSYRIDPYLRIEKQGEAQPLVEKDTGGPGEAERSGSLEVEPGRYYIMVSNVVSPVIGEYELTVRYEQKYNDPNEPNDEPYQAVRIARNTDYVGIIDPDDDEDWFSFRLDETSYITLLVSNIPADRVMSLNLYTGIQEPVSVDVNQRGVRQIEASYVLDPGHYYIRLTADKKFENQQYKLRMSTESLQLGYRDLSGHWAAEEIVELTDRRIVTGYLDYTFRPNSPITRAEATMMIGKAIELQPSTNKRQSYQDVSQQHWAYEAIQFASQANVIAGYPDGNFLPSRELSRAEMAIMLANALGFEPLSAGETRFSDVPSRHWGFEYINRMSAEGLISGYENGEFRPNANATRAELSSLIFRVLQLK